MINKGMFNDFVDKMEVVYVVLLAWGFARVAEFFVWNITYILAAIISGLVLIRFFFAASHNLKPVAVKSKGSSLKQIFLFLFDIPMLVLHSFIYYRMNFLLSQRDYFGFYRIFDWLLFVNTLWLLAINLRIKTSDNKILPWCSKWTINNFIFGVIILFLLISRDYYLLFCFSLLNCLLDFFWTAPCYLGFQDMP